MPQCPGCNKFPTYDMSNEPEIDSLDVTVDLDEKDHNKGTANISGYVRIALTSECCGEEMKEYTFDVDVTDVEVKKHAECTCGDEWHEGAEADGSGEITDRSETSRTKTFKRGPKAGQTVQIPIPYRYQRRYYGASVHIELDCACGKQVGPIILFLAKAMATPAQPRREWKYRDELAGSYSSAPPSTDRWNVSQFEKSGPIRATVGNAAGFLTAFNAKLDNLLNEPDLLEEGEPAPSTATLAQIRGIAQFISDRGISVSLPEISVYFGEVDLTWRFANRLLRLIAYREPDHKPMTVYQQTDFGEPLTRGQLTPVTSVEEILPEKFAWLNG